MAKPFKFKEFTVHQDRCAMKIGTDGVLLGAWVPLHRPDCILDIGSGTGIIALQLAQRSGANTIDAVEIDDAAYEQCSENFEASPWADRLFCYHASIQEFASEIDESYDLIVSNPPFYREDYKTSNDARDTARFTDALPFQHLLVCAAHLLSRNGHLSVIIPKKEEENFLLLAADMDLFPVDICHVKGSNTSEVKRSMILLSREKKETTVTSLTIETARHHYTEEYIALVKDFYLKM
ncbi:MAG: methyltransferase [Bacteroidota bacterium]